jgi:A/G-specific adenine glycosylase
MTPARKKQSGKKDSQRTGLDFSEMLISWQKVHGRHTLPWQQTKDVYRIWLSEIMLQQTQVVTVIPYYARFLTRFPDVGALAVAPLDEVMAQWSGLGYYSRARNLHRCAQEVVKEYGGDFPVDPLLLEKLPGIGRSTAAAISVFSSGTRAAILDGNVIRVLSRIFGVTEYPGNKRVKDKLWELAESLLPDSELKSYTQGLMDFGATLCVRSRPLCHECPFSSCCVAFLENRVKELPIKKPSKGLLLRQTYMLIFVYQDKVLLEKRPESGIWGGLLSLPELSENRASMTEGVLENTVAPFGKMASHQLQEEFVHVFTHFRLQITPILVRLSAIARELPEKSYVWYSLIDIENAPLPAPVKSILKGLKIYSGD